MPHQLLVLTDVSRALREEERQAWQRLIRVLGHELNNSLAPIKSLAGSLDDLVAREPRPPDWEADLRRGLAVIGGRAESLEPLPGRVRAAGAPAAAAAPADRPGRAGAARRGAGDAAAAWRSATRPR